MNPPTTDELDVQDMRRLAGGNEAALNALMDRHAEKLFHYFVRCLQSEDDAADLAQEAFVKLYQSCTRFDTTQRFSTWLYSIASNLVKDRYRWRSRHPQVSLEAEREPTGLSLRDCLPAVGLSPPETVQAEERAEAVRRAVAALPEELRAPLILAEYEERSQAEIGTILGCTAKAVEMRIYRARQQLRVSLEKWLRPQ